jgi:hypothetical protein
MEFNGLINKNHDESIINEGKKIELEKQLDHEFDMVTLDGSTRGIDLDIGKPVRLFAAGSWRDICKKKDGGK